MSQTVIKVENISKQYRIGAREGYKTFRETLIDAAKAPFILCKDIAKKAIPPFNSTRDSKISSGKNTIWALKDVSFEVKRGDVVGIIGRNGAGKSTLLKILSKITMPTEGRIELRGRIGSLLEVGTGFHPELSGHENIYLYGAILGMDRWEVTRKFDEIVAFAELEKFVDTPVKRYSSGMYMRLAFAVAAHLEPEILLVDEVLAVGDAAFQKKCLGKMGDVSREGRTVLFVSHNMGAIEGLCGKAYMLEQGRVDMTGNTHDVVEAYIASFSTLGNQPLDDRPDRQGDGRLKFTDITFHSANDVASEVVQCGQDLKISIGYKSDMNSLQNVTLSVGILTLGGQCMLMLNNQMVGAEFDSLPSSGRFLCSIDRFPMSPGQYYLNLYCEVNGVLSDWVQQAVYLMVEAGDFFGTGRLPPRTHGGLLVPQTWQVINSETGP